MALVTSPSVSKMESMTVQRQNAAQNAAENTEKMRTERAAARQESATEGAQQAAQAQQAEETRATFSARAQELAARDTDDSSVKKAEQVRQSEAQAVQQMSLLNDQVRRAYASAA